MNSKGNSENNIHRKHKGKQHVVPPEKIQLKQNDKTSIQI